MRGALADRPVVAVNRLLGAVGGERRGRVIGGWFVWSTGRRLGRSLMDTLRPPGKPFAISKWEVWEAYRQVKANKGAPGADGCSLEDFEKDLKGNLYKIWNRMSSGSYLPPPVLAVEIPKPHGEGTRVLGVPTIADRIAQTVVARRLEEAVEPIFHPDSYGYRPGRSALDAVAVCRRRCWAKNWVIDLDVERFFDSVPWDLLVKAVAAHTDQPWVVLDVTRWLQAPLQHPDGTVQQRDRGTPQGRRSRPCWRTCSCTTRSTPGWPGGFRPSSSSGTPTMPWCTASASARPGCWSGRSPTGWSRSGCGCIRPRPGSCTARTASGSSTTSTPRSPSWGSRSAPAGHAAHAGSGSPRSCPRSARTPLASSALRSAAGGCIAGPACP